MLDRSRLTDQEVRRTPVTDYFITLVDNDKLSTIQFCSVLFRSPKNGSGITPVMMSGCGSRPS